SLALGKVALSAHPGAGSVLVRPAAHYLSAHGRRRPAPAGPVLPCPLGAPRWRRDPDVPRRGLRHRAPGRPRRRLAAARRDDAPARDERGGVRAASLLPRDRRRPYGVRPPLRQGPVPRPGDPDAARAPPAADRDRRPRAPPGALRPADPRERGARDGAADHPRLHGQAHGPAERTAHRGRADEAVTGAAPGARAPCPPRRDARPPLLLGARAPQG